MKVNNTRYINITIRNVLFQITLDLGLLLRRLVLNQEIKDITENRSVFFLLDRLKRVC